MQYHRHDPVSARIHPKKSHQMQEEMTIRFDQNRFSQKARLVIPGKNTLPKVR
jgi:hypothetical protein